MATTLRQTGDLGELEVLIAYMSRVPDVPGTSVLCVN